MPQLEFHEASNIFPMMGEAEYYGLREDIRVHGQIEPIYLCADDDGELKILDGRNRYKACLELGIEPRCEVWTGASPVDYVVSMNLKRRHLTSSQLAVVARNVEREKAKEAERKEYERKTTFQKFEKSNIEPIHAAEQAAEIVGTNRQYVIDVKRIEEKAPELIPHILAGDMTITEAKRQVKQMEVTTPAAMVSPDAPKQYRVFYADPPWKYGNNGLDQYGPAERHYPSMTISELCELGTEIQNASAENAVLFLWVTSPMLEDAFKVIRAWGFQYKTSFVWDKVKHNFGYYNSVRHEFLLICTRGSCVPDCDTKLDSVQTIERSNTHSAKPSEFRDIIDMLYQYGDRIELFARSEQPGWIAWGNEKNEHTT